MPPPDPKSEPARGPDAGVSPEEDRRPIVPLRGPSAGLASRWLEHPDEALCFCFGVTVGEVAASVLARRSPRVECVAADTQAGSACGSCRIEIADIIRALLSEEPDMSVDGPPRKPGP
jgi:NAD(P)H-nitrite reductase large subunit